MTRTEYDSSLRPWRVFGENFAAPESQTIYGVPNSNGQFPADQRFVKVRKQIDASNWDEATTWFDGLGRTVKTQAKDSQGDVFVETVYDAFGRVERVTNPYRIGDTVYWSKTRYDAAGRAVESYAPATLAEITAAAGNNNANLTSLGVTSFDISTVAGYVGTVVTTTDASLRKGRSVTNALGQLIRVDEPTATGGTADADLGTLAAPHQPTSYKYDAYGKMVEVTQGAQKRWFKYDSLGRLLRVRQPEQEVNTALNLPDAHNTSGQWTAGFTYDVLGNVLTATDANNVTITNTYDRANRVKTRSYSGETGPTTPAVSFHYDGKGLAAPQSPNFAKGKLTKVTSSVSETQYSLFDNFGRLTESKQVTDGQTYTSSYQYNLSGALVQETYPSGRVVKNEFEPDGDLLTVTSKKTGTDVFRQYASNFSYTAAGGITQMRLGNGKWETAVFNPRLQVTELGLGSSAANAGLWKVNYTYGEFDNDWNLDANKNTGNIAKQTLTIPGATFVQNYRYDSLYRLREAVEPGPGSTPNWTQAFDYDRYGNRTSFTQTVGGVTTHNSTPAVSASSNRFTSTDFEFDKNGNLVGDVDPATSQARDFLFNGDNKQREVIVNSASVGQYFYDGEGKRVKKVAGSETTVFVYSAGKLVAEYTTSGPPSTGHINYTTTDHLGSPRIITNELGKVTSRRDFMPFGEDLNAGIGNRTADPGKYSAPGDKVRQKFTGYQKDDETKLDFAEARMYENRHGRFTAVDPLLVSGKSANPQSFNRYIYVRNNPTFLTDPTGLCDEKTCPKNYYGTVYTRTVNGEAFYNNEAPDSSWTVFKSDAEFTRKSTGIRTVVNEFGWYESPIAAGNEAVAPLMSGFRTDFFGSLNGLWKGPANFAIVTWNSATDAALRGGVPYYPTVAPNPLAMEPFPVYSDAEARNMVGSFLGSMFAPSAIAAPFSAGGSFSVVPQGARVPKFEAGRFSIVDWTGYPEGYARPSGTFRLLKGAEYDGARALANTTNRAMRAENPAMYRGFQIHEIKPVKFGGSPTDRTNKLILTQPEHARFNTFWMRLQRSVEQK